jgi:imidazolonepropionase-like amidohydrolase
VPYYTRNSLPSYLMWFMAQPATPEEAARTEGRNIANGADLLKLFTGSYVERGKVLPMPEPIASAAVAVAHRQGQLAYSHPSDLAGTRVAIDSGVDVLAHAPDNTEGVDAALLGRMVARHMAMIPTLKMFATTVTTKPSYLQPIYAVVRQFHALGGDLIFGTDVGYMTDYRTGGEFRALEASGLDARDILRMLTTAPAARFGVARERGTIASQKMADLVLLDGDPDHDLTAFERVRWTIRNGRVVYQSH